MPSGPVLVILALGAIGYMGVHAIKKPVNAAAKKTAHGVVHVVTLGKK